MDRRVSTACLCAFLAGCGRAEVTSVVPRPQAATNVAQRVVVSILIPKTRTASASRRPLYISSSTKSLALSVNGTPPVIANLVAGSPGCTTTAQDDISCTISVSVPPGNDTFEETLYDQVQSPGATSPSGNPLSHVKQVVVIKAGQPNAVRLTLNGVIASISLQLPANLALVQGTTTIVPLAVSAQDAGGNTIIADPYDNPISLSTSDRSMTLSSSSFATPADTVTLTYNGAGTPAVKITASAPGALGGGTPSSTLAATASVTLPAPRTPNSTDWTTFGFDAQRTGNNPSEAALGSSAVSHGLGLKWSVKIPGASYADTQPLVVTNVFVNGVYDDLVIVGDERGGLTAFNAVDGSVIWRNATSGSQTVGGCADIPDRVFGVTGTPAVDRANNRVYVVGGAGKMYAVDIASGATLTGWGPATVTTNPAQDHAYSAVTFDAPNHRAFVSTASYCDIVPSAEGMRAVDTNSGTVVAGPLYFNPPSSSTLSAGIWGPGGLSVDPRGSGYLYGAIGNTINGAGGVEDAIVQVTSGMQLNAYNMPPTTLPDADFGGSPVVYQDGGACLAVEQKTGILFVYNLDAISSGPSQAIAIGSASSAGTNLGTPAYSDHIVYVPAASSGAYSHGMLAFDVQQGCRLSFRWQQTFTGTGNQPGNAPFSPPTVANGVVYAGDGLGRTLYALDARSGAMLWHYTVTSPIFTAPTVADGRLYAVTWNATLYAFGP
jgi:outer membrane protein assembly factor BamB